MLTERSRIARPASRLTLCSSLAIATALLIGSGQARAQTAPSGSFQGTPTVVAGSASISTGTGTTNVNVNGNAVINWTTFDTAIGGGPINFQPTNTTATFSSSADFAVLNRILPSDPGRAIQFNGSVVSQIQQTLTTIGGTVYFYSPGGVILGANAMFNVGNLGLTTASPVFNPTTGTFDTGGVVTFSQANPGTAVQIQAGAQINALATNSTYVALVAPVVRNAGGIKVNGSAALVNADSATITFRTSGLFDIQVTSGTSASGNNSFITANTGSITGPAGDGVGSFHRVYLVAVPKNDAITLAIQNGTLGFDVAGAANVVGSAVVLSAGYDIIAGAPSGFRSPGSGTGRSDIQIFGGNATSDFSAVATGSAIFSGSNGNSNFSSNVTLAGARPVGDATVAAQFAVAGAANTTNVAGDLRVIATDPGVSAPAGSSVAAQFARVQALNGGTINVGQNLLIRANATGVPGSAGSATGGNASLDLFDGGRISVSQNSTVSALGQGGNAVSQGGAGGAGNGGSASVNLSNSVGNTAASTLNIGGQLLIEASGAGGSGTGTGSGGVGIGGLAQVFGNGGNVTISGGYALTAQGRGGGSMNGNGGAGTGGQARVTVNNGTASFAAPAGTFAQITASAFGGNASGSGNGGAAGAGIAHIFVNGGNVSIAGDVSLLSEAYAGSGVNGGDAVSARPFRQPRALIGGFRGSVTVGGKTSLSASAQGGDGRSGGRGGLAFAGNAAVDMQSAAGGGSLGTFNTLQLNTAARGGIGGGGIGSLAGGVGGDAYGGFSSASGNAGNGRLVVTGITTLIADALGGMGGVGGSGGSTAAGSAGGVGGRAFGGGITVSSVSGVETTTNTGSARFADVSGSGSAFGGAGGAGGVGTTSGNGGEGGAAFGGGATVLVRGSPVAVGTVNFTANGTGGNGGAGALAGVGGDGAAGSTNVITTQRFQRTERGTFTANTINLSTAGVAGTGSVAGTSYYSATAGAEDDLFIRQSDVQIGNLSITHRGTAAPNFSVTALSVNDPATNVEFANGLPQPRTFTVAAEPFDVTLLNSTAQIGSFSATTPGEMRLTLDGSTLTSNTLSLSARNFVLPARAPTLPGTINVSGALTLNTQQNFATFANFSLGTPFLYNAPGVFQMGNLTSTAPIRIVAAGPLTLQNVSGSTIDLRSSQATSLGNVTQTGSGTLILRGAQITAGNLLAPAALIDVASSGAILLVNLQAFANTTIASQQSITTGSIQTTGTIQLNANGTIATGDLRANQIVNIGSNGAVNTGNIDAGDRVLLQAIGAANIGNVTAGIVNRSTAASANRIGIAANSLNAGNLNAIGEVLIGVTQALATGTVGGRDAMLLAGTTITTGGISAGNLNPTTGVRSSTGRILLANNSMGTLGGTFGNFNPVPVFAAVPVATSGSITVSGASTGRQFVAATQQNFSAGAITLASASTQFNPIQITAGGTIGVSGTWQADAIELTSSDLDIASGGALVGTGFGEISLVSTNTNQVLLGDGLSGSGYTLNNAEFGRIRGGDIFIAARENSGQAVGMLIGDLAVSGSQLGSFGELTLVVGDRNADSLTAGLIRVNGNVIATGFGAEQGIDLTAGTVEVNAATGTLSVTGSNNQISGYLELEGDRIHVASDEILLKLRANPQYLGYIRELNAPAAVQRPEGVIRAAAVDLEGNKSILIQNTGTRQLPAGVFAGFDPRSGEEGTDIGGEVTMPGGLDIVFNGQLQRPDGTILTGRQAFAAARAAALADLDAGEVFGADLVPSSTFNGCGITSGVCAGAQDPVAAISSEITIVTNAALDDSPVAPAADDSDEGGDGSSDQDEDEDDSDEGSSPIEAPAALISTRALDGDVNVVEPVSGAGNPALFGSAVNETTVQGGKP